MNEQNPKKVAMLIVAHADDAEFDGAGTAALWAQEGWDIYFVICADGGSGGPDDALDVSHEARQRIVLTREQEQRDAGRILGLKDVFFLGYPDGQLRPSQDVKRDIVRLLRQYKPSRVICQSPERVWTPSFIIQRYHSDHLAAGQATLEAIYPASQNPWDFPELLEEEHLLPHKVSEIFITNAPTLNYAIDISTTMDVKMAALRAHKSQVGDHIAELEQMLRSIDSEAGKKHGYVYAEEFHHTVVNG